MTKTTKTCIIIGTILLIIFGVWYACEYKECEAKGGILARPIFGFISCVKEI